MLALWFPILLPAYVLRFKIGPLPTTALELAFLALIVFVTYKNGWSIWREGYKKTRTWHLPAAFWILATLIAVFVAPDHIGALGLWRAYVLEPIVYAILLAATIKTDKDKQTVVMALVASVVFVTTYATIQFITGMGIPHPWNTVIATRRATGPFPFPNALSLFCVPIAALCFGKIVERRASSVAWVGFVAGLVGTLLAKSVGGFLGILAAVFFALLWKKSTRLPVIGAALIVLAAILFVPALNKPIVSTLSFKQWSGQVRTIIWKETTAMLKDRPVLGAGLGAYPDVIKPYHKATFIEIFQYPHNILLNLWSETGLLGIFAFGWICVTWIRASLRKTTLQPTAYSLLPLIAILIHGLVDVPYFKNDLAFQFWTLVILLI